MKEIYIDHVGYVKLVTHVREAPRPSKFCNAWDGYRIYKTPAGLYAVEE